MKPTPILAVVFALATTSCRTARPRTNAPAASPTPLVRASNEADQAAITAVLDDWHAAAGAADGARYFGHMAEDSVFLGTDATERWPLADFRAFCEPYFAKGVGWTYVPKERHLVVEGDVAWFDEKLWNDKYGDCRGTGALRRVEGAWKIAHYSLTLLVPNERAPDVIRAIRGK